jgi:hypothetical protein
LPGSGAQHRGIDGPREDGRSTPLQFVWRHPDRHEVEIALYVQLRMVHVRGWRHLVVAQEPRGATWVCVEMAPETSEENARDWSSLFDARYRVPATLGDVLATPGRWSELYIDAGIARFLERHERQLERDADARRRWREGGR